MPTALVMGLGLLLRLERFYGDGGVSPRRREEAKVQAG